MRTERNDWLDDAVVRDQLSKTEALIASTVSRPGATSRPQEATPKTAPFHHQAVSPRSKRLRPALLLLASRFGDAKDGKMLVRAAAAIELVHEATLYHD